MRETNQQKQTGYGTHHAPPVIPCSILAKHAAASPTAMAIARFFSRRESRGLRDTWRREVEKLVSRLEPIAPPPRLLLSVAPARGFSHHLSPPSTRVSPGRSRKYHCVAPSCRLNLPKKESVAPALWHKPKFQTYEDINSAGEGCQGTEWARTSAQKSLSLPPLAPMAFAQSPPRQPSTESCNRRWSDPAPKALNRASASEGASLTERFDAIGAEHPREREAIAVVLNRRASHDPGIASGLMALTRQIIRWRGKASRVEVAGSFTTPPWEKRLPLTVSSEHRDAPECSLQKDVDGDVSNPPDLEWSLDFADAIPGLQPGAYQFKLIVDDEWIYDPAYPVQQDDDGNTNNVVFVPSSLRKSSSRRFRRYPSSSPRGGPSVDPQKCVSSCEVSSTRGLHLGYSVFMPQLTENISTELKSQRLQPTGVDECTTPTIVTGLSGAFGMSSCEAFEEQTPSSESSEPCSASDAEPFAKAVLAGMHFLQSKTSGVLKLLPPHTGGDLSEFSHESSGSDVAGDRSGSSSHPDHTSCDGVPNGGKNTFASKRDHLVGSNRWHVSESRCSTRDRSASPRRSGAAFETPAPVRSATDKTPLRRTKKGQLEQTAEHSDGIDDTAKKPSWHQSPKSDLVFERSIATRTSSSPWRSLPRLEIRERGEAEHDAYTRRSIRVDDDVAYTSRLVSHDLEDYNESSTGFYPASSTQRVPRILRRGQSLISHNWPSAVTQYLHPAETILDLTIPDARLHKGLRLEGAACMISHSDRRDCSGADAYFCINEGGVSAAGVADGVGEWEIYGLNPRHFAEELMRGCEKGALYACAMQPAMNPHSGIERVEVEKEANGISYLEEIKSKQLPPEDVALRLLLYGYAQTKAYGSSTACVAYLDPTGCTLGVANLGDSCMMLLRRQHATSSMAVVQRTKEQQHGFNCPFQLSRLPKAADVEQMQREGGHESLVNILKSNCMTQQDTPQEAQLCSVNVREGDLLLVATDGIFDNLFDEEICSIAHLALSPYDALMLRDESLETPARAVASAIAEAAHHKSKSTRAKTPFAEAAKANRTHYTGGKIDDITVVACWLRRKQDVKPSLSSPDISAMQFNPEGVTQCAPRDAVLT